jgi:hypothetical protein
MLGDLSRNEGDALWEFDDTVISMAEALEAFKDLDPISVRWIEGAAVRQVKDEYAQKARLMKEAWYKEKEAHVATKKKMLVKEIRALEKLAEAYREVARLKEKYECGLHPEDDYLQQQQIDDALHQKQIYEAEQPQTDSEGTVSTSLGVRRSTEAYFFIDIGRFEARASRTQFRPIAIRKQEKARTQQLGVRVRSRHTYQRPGAYFHWHKIDRGDNLCLGQMCCPRPRGEICYLRCILLLMFTNSGASYPVCVE